MTPTPAPPEPPYKVTSAADILSYIPHTLGFQPRESLVLLTMCGKRVGATLRVDLPEDDQDPEGYAAGVCSILAADTSADGSLLVLYTSDPWKEAESPPRLELVHCLRVCLKATGLQLRDGWLVTATAWRDYFCDSQSCCPWPGHPLESVLDSPLNAELVFRGSSFASSLSAAMETDTPEPWTDPVALDRLCQGQRVMLGRRWTSTAQLVATIAVWDCLLVHSTAAVRLEDPEVAAHLLASLGSRTLRDTVLVLAALGWEAALGGAVGNGLGRSGRGAAYLPPGAWALLGLEPGQSLPPTSHAPDESHTRGFCDVLIGQHRGPLLWERVDAAHLLLSRLSAVAGGESRAALLTMLGWIEWARGRGSRAHMYLLGALEEEPGYSLAELLQEVVARGMLAEWSRDGELAWHNGLPHPA
ncbi:DUF4192 domain-containing protein [Arthrobacter sp. H20]|uniref:DUF4192 domain-containing protein n=1 Tax=Arthrobacter sp. H20 TaxID=1267981 RepID=UPI00047CC14A|nr:DUF4192 domain-containing protein [Arthrobacter sp. H20]